ncbi:uncharacterized protein [Paramisgurnus dabryanus]|uniref:uncharacterized protein n=1 Tax=Paramisgurnus dabryanus TaxID=90735 RepID=UPI0031F3C173
MSQICLPDVKDLQSMKAVSDLLQEGIGSICNIRTSLFNAQVDYNTGKCLNYEKIRKHIEHADQCLKESEKMSKEKLQSLDESMEHLVKEKERVDQIKKEKNIAKNKLHADKTSAEEMLKISKKALEQEEKKLVSEEETLEKEKASLNSSAVLTGVGAGLLLIPGPGWIAGKIMICEGLCRRNYAKKSIRAGEEEITKAESQLREYTSKVSDYQSRISELQNKIEKTNEDLNKIQEEIEWLKQHLEVIAEIQKNVRQAVFLLSVLSGRVTVLEKQTERFIVWEPVMKVMEDVMEAAFKIAKNHVLYQGLSGVKNPVNPMVEFKGASWRHSV